jgi:hypothetical protein
LREKRIYGKLLPFLRLEIAHGQVSLDFDIPFDESNLKDAEDLVYFLTKNVRVEEEACIS